MKCTDESSTAAVRQRHVRSFVLRRGRYSEAQQRAYREGFPRWGIEWSGNMLDWPALFGRSAPVVLEIGFGMGLATSALANAHPGVDFVGIEVHTPGVASLFQQAQTLGLDNIRAIEADAVEVLDHGVPDGSLAAVHVWFPDPWPKARHHKRRLLHKDFVHKLLQKIRIGGYVHVATDWAPYAVSVAELLTSLPTLDQTPPEGHFRLGPHDIPSNPQPSRSIACAAERPFSASTFHPMRADRRHLAEDRESAHELARSMSDPRPPWRPVTRFERRGELLGHDSYDFVRWRVR